MKTFKDSLKTAVFTSRFVIKDKKDITFISHDNEDGAWQFLSNDNFDNYEEIAMIVSLDEILQIDKTILDIADLPLGYIATRQTLSDNWIIKKITPANNGS